MNATVRRWSRQPRRPGADSDFTITAAVEAAAVARNQVQMALQCFSYDNVAGATAYLEGAHRQIDYSICVLRDILAEFKQ